MLKDIAYITTLAGYVHWKLTGEKLLGIGDASGMFPIDIKSQNFDQKRIGAFDIHVAGKAKGWSLKEILPEIRPAGTLAGKLTSEGAALLDVSGTLKAGDSTLSSRR